MLLHYVLKTDRYAVAVRMFHPGASTKIPL
jgi:hypothetical protein